MRTRIQKWGNSLALRIPQAFAREAHLMQGDEVDLNLDNGRLVIVPVAEPQVTLGLLLERITTENLHGEIDSGPPVGVEVW